MKNKLITVRVSEDLQAKFNQWLSFNRLSGSEFLRGIIEDCVNGKIDTNNLKIDTLLDSQLDKLDSIDSEQIKKLEIRLNELESNLSSQIASHIAIQLNELKQSFLNELDMTRQDRQIDNVNSGIDKLDSIDKLDTNQLNLLDYLDSQNEDAIGNDKPLDSVNPKIDNKVSTAENPEALTQSEVESLPSENELESEENNEGIITTEIKNKEVKGKPRRGKLKPLPEDFFNLPCGKIPIGNLTKILGYQASSSVTRIAHGETNPPFENFWDYLEVKPEKVRGKDSLVWYKIK